MTVRLAFSVIIVIKTLSNASSDIKIDRHQSRLQRGRWTDRQAQKCRDRRQADRETNIKTYRLKDT